MHEKQLIEKYMNKGVIELSTIGTVEPFIRKILLSWIGKSMASKNRKVKTDYGLTVEVKLDKSKMITLQAEDGKLSMPNAVFLFGKEGVK